VFEQLICAGSAPNVDAETDGKESLQLFAKFFRFLQPGRAIRGDEIERLEWFLIEVWGLGFDHLNCHDSKRPDINFRTVLLLLDDLRCHPVRRTNHSGTLRFGFCKLCTESEISCNMLVGDCWEGTILLTDFDISSGVQ
jgi:hypothetical protein